MDITYGNRNLYRGMPSNENPLKDLLEAMASFNSLPKLPKPEIWLSQIIPNGYIIKIPAVQNGERFSFTDFVDEIWFVNEEDFNKLDILQKEETFIFPVFRPGGIPVIKKP